MFAAFLVWQHIGMQRRVDAMSDRFTDSLDRINADYDARIEAMRERYDAVIQGIRAEAVESQKEFLRNYSAIREGIIEQLRDNSRKLDMLSSREPPAQD